MKINKKQKKTIYTTKKSRTNEKKINIGSTRSRKGRKREIRKENS